MNNAHTARDENQFGFLCVTESFGWTAGPRGTKTRRGEGGRGTGERGRQRRKPGEVGKGGGGGGGGRSGPPGQTIAARWECGSRALPVPKAHSCQPGRPARSKQPGSSSGVGPSQANGPVFVWGGGVGGVCTRALVTMTTTATETFLFFF